MTLTFPGLNPTGALSILLTLGAALPAAANTNCTARMTTDYVADMFFLYDTTPDAAACTALCRDVADESVGVFKDDRFYDPVLKRAEYACLFEGVVVSEYVYPDGYRRD